MVRYCHFVVSPVNYSDSEERTSAVVKPRTLGRGVPGSRLSCFAVHCGLEYNTPILLYRDDSCIGDFTYHVNIHSQRHLAIVYVRNISIQISNSQLQQKFCKMSNIVTIRFIYLQMACRKQYHAYYGYPRPIKYPSSTSKILLFHYFQVWVCRSDVRGHAAIFGHFTSVYGKFSQYAKVWDEISASNNN